MLQAIARKVIDAHRYAEYDFRKSVNEQPAVHFD
jgi:hypothetical protein